MSAPHRLSDGPAALVLALVLALVPAGCAGYPTAPLKTDLLSPEHIAARYSLDTAWWQAYADPDLDRLVRAALAANTDLARSAVAVNRALYEARLLSEDLVPAFSAEASGASRRNIKTGDGATRSYESALGVSYELDLWQKLRNAASAREWEYLATVEDRETARLALINSVVDTYFRLCYLDQAARVTAAGVERYRQLLELTRAKYELGKAAGVEPLQAEQALLASLNNLDNLRSQQATARQTLRDLLNLRPGADPDIPERDLMTAVTAGVDLEVPVAALAARPDIRAAEDRLQKAFKTLQADRAAWYPTITVGGSLSASSDRATSFFNVPFLGGNVRITFPFLQWNTLRWNTKIAEADFESAELDFISAVTGALNEVQAAYLQYTTAQHMLHNTIAKHEKDKKISVYYKDRYDLGAGELKDYLDALNTEEGSMLSALEAKYTVISQENRIYKAMGGRYERRER